jgi:Nucleoside-diphosphate-sugar epimerases
MLVAVTGASGFIGRRLLMHLAAAGHRTRALLRSTPGDLDPAPTEVITGDLADAEALTRLTRGADVVIHLAGRIKARRRADYFAVNRDGTAALVRALAGAEGEPHLLLISSLAAREPRLSDYAASKQAAEIEAGRTRAQGDSAAPAGGLRSRRSRDPALLPACETLARTGSGAGGRASGADSCR